jgi:hypothetical protein
MPSRELLLTHSTTATVTQSILTRKWIEWLKVSWQQSALLHELGLAPTHSITRRHFVKVKKR